MKLRWMACGFVAGVGLTIGGSHVLSQDGTHQHDGHAHDDHSHGDDDHAHDHAGQDMDPAAMEDMMALMAEMGSPSDNHKMLEYFTGSWTVKSEMMGMPPSEAEASLQMIYDGRFLVQNYEGSMMGQPFEGAGIIGFDNYKNKFRGVWVDSISTTILVSEGMLDQTGKRITMYGEMDEYMTGEHDKIVKYVYQIVDEDTWVFELHDMGIVPGETKVMSATYTRN